MTASLHKCGRRGAAQTSDGLHSVSVSLLHVDRDRLRGNTIRHHDQVTDAQLLIGWHIEMRGHEPPKPDGHAAVVVRPAVKNVSGCLVGDAHQRVIRGGLVIVSIGSPLLESIEQVARDDIRTTRINRGGSFLDPRCPRGVVGARWRVNIDLVEVG